MKKLFSLLLLLAVMPLSAKDGLTEAAALYFNSRQQEALDKYVQISKQTNEREAFLNAAYIALEMGNARLAVDTMSQALKLYPADEQVLEFAGEAYLSSGYYLNAENVFARLSELNDKTEFYYINLARAQIGLDHLDLALSNLKLAEAGKNHTALANFLLGDIYEKQNNLEAAENAYKKVLDYDFQSIEAKKRYADILAKRKKYNEAWRNYSSVLAVERNHPLVLAAANKVRPRVTREEPAGAPAAKKPFSPLTHTHISRPVSFEGALPMIRVGLGSKINGAPQTGVKEVKFSTSHKFTAVDKDGKTILKGEPKTFWKAEVTKDGRLALVSPKGRRSYFTAGARIKQTSPDYQAHTTIIKDLMVGHGTTWRSREDKEYRGEMEFVFNKSLGGFIIINHVNIEEYVMGVTAAEMPSTFPIEALKTQAVIARTYGIKGLGRMRKWGYDVCDTQNSQVYGGVRAERERTNAAAEATIGLILTHKGKPVEAVFSSNTGGFTQSSREAGWSTHQYLQPVSDYHNYDALTLQPYQLKELLQQPQEAYSRFINPNISASSFRWTRYVEEPLIRELAKKRKDIGPILSVVPVKRGRSGYVNGVRINGEKGSITLTKENEIKRYLALGMLRSTYFITEPVMEKGKPKAFIFYGGGWGHGVGLCQTGAGGRAQAGQNFEQILNHYYTDTLLTDVRKK